MSSCELMCAFVGDCVCSLRYSNRDETPCIHLDSLGECCSLHGTLDLMSFSILTDLIHQGLSLLHHAASWPLLRQVAVDLPVSMEGEPSETVWNFEVGQFGSSHDSIRTFQDATMTSSEIVSRLLFFP